LEEIDMSLLKILTVFVVLVATCHAMPSTHNSTENMIETMRRNMIWAYSAYCPPNALKNWNCYWCKLAPKIQIVDTAYASDATVGGYVGYDNDFVYVIFRGSKALNLQSWITNLRTSREIGWPLAFPGSHVHKGFVDGFNEISGKITEAVRKLAPQGKRIKILGHSR
jgi:hypothetical protein